MLQKAGPSVNRVVAIVLARAGSKGLPRKNALPVAGRPMLAWTIEHALRSTQVQRVVLSTDGEELAQIGRAYGAEVVLRPKNLASDTATVDAAARQVVDQLGDPADAYALLYGNVPVRPADLTDRAVAKLRETGADSVQSVCPVGKMHPYWMKTVDGDRLGMYVDNAVYRRQDLPPVYMLDGGVIVVTRDSLETVVPGQPHAFLGDDRRAITTRPGEVVDVDEDLDLHIAEAILKRRAQPISS